MAVDKNQFDNTSFDKTLFDNTSWIRESGINIMFNMQVGVGLLTDLTYIFIT